MQPVALHSRAAESVQTEVIQQDELVEIDDKAAGLDENPDQPDLLEKESENDSQNDEIIENDIANAENDNEEKDIEDNTENDEINIIEDDEDESAIETEEDKSSIQEEFQNEDESSQDNTEEQEIQEYIAVPEEIMFQSETTVQEQNLEVVEGTTQYNGIDYSAVYDFDYYIAQYDDIKSNFSNNAEAALEHFVNYGMSEGRQGRKDFNVYTYKNRYPDLRSAFGNDLRQYFIHYIWCGKAEGRDGSGKSEVTGYITNYNGIDYSKVYDYNFYIEHNADIREAFSGNEQMTLEHFVNFGMAEGRQAREDFNVYTYKNRYPDLRNAFGRNIRNYYEHYLYCGAAEGRSGSGASEIVGYVTVYAGIDYGIIYDYTYYTKIYSDIKNAFGNDDIAVLEHFVNCGMSEGRRGKGTFDVQTYKNRYPDLRNAFGNDLKKYYLHYLSYGAAEGRSGSGISGRNGYATTLNDIDYSAVYDFDYYISQYPDIRTVFGEDDYKTLEHFVNYGMAEGRRGSKEFNVYTYMNNYNDLWNTYKLDLKPYYLHYINYGKVEGRTAVGNESEPPISSDLKDKYMGYYEGYKITSKKGIQGVSTAYTEDLQAQHILLNVDIADLVSNSPCSGYVTYQYGGNTYYFQDLIALRKTVYDLHGWGSTEGNAYGQNHNRAVTFNLLLSWKDDLSYLIHPSARVKGVASYYSLNMQEDRARKTFEALFAYLGDEFGTDYKRRVSNWTLGNEVNSCKTWNYAGTMSFQTYVQNYAQAFQMLYKGVHRTITSSRVFISLDHCWTASDAGYSGKQFLDTFAAYMNQTAPNMRWNVNYHPYSQPLNQTDYWNDYSNTTDNVNTRYISMRNIQILTDYLASLESQYGKSNGNIRVIIGELGYSGIGGNQNQENSQAAALGYGYYKAMFNTRIDAYIIRAYMDDPAETKSGLYLGLRRNDNAQSSKISYSLYKNLDTSESLNYMNQYKGILGVSSWESVIPGFDASKLVAADF